MSEPGFWGDQSAAQAVVQQVKTAKNWVEPFDTISGRVESARELEEMLALEPDDELSAEVDRETRELGEAIEAFRLRSLLSGPDDFRDAQLEISAGAGGTEAQDWAEMLMRMYLRWCEKKGFKSFLLDEQAGEGAGIKSAAIEVQGEYAYGYLKAENGVHRLVRISPFDANARRHTSFASIFVYPEIEDDVEIEINPADLKIDTYRSGGKGGQNVNKVETAVRIKHIPSGVVVACQQERSQFQNKERAMKMLKSRLYQLRKEEEEAKRDALNSTKKKIEWGSQIRSYVLAPYRLVKDHRTGFEMGDADRVLGGDLDGYIRAALGAARETSEAKAGGESRAARSEAP